MRVQTMQASPPEVLQGCFLFLMVSGPRFFHEVPTGLLYTWHERCMLHQGGR